MKSITFMLEYGCIPIWVHNEEEELICVGLPKDLEHNCELKDLLEEISEEHDALYIDTAIEFSYRGFLSEVDKTNFNQKVYRAIQMLREAAKGKYEVVVTGCYADSN